MATGTQAREKMAGLVGGTGPESTVEYYKQIIALWRERVPDGSYPSLVIRSLNLAAMMALVRGGEMSTLADMLLIEIRRLQAAGASFAALTANTPHLVFDELRQRSPIPLISIVEAARNEIVRRGIARPLLLGTQFTMQAPFYPKVFAGSGAELVVPEASEQAWIHEKYVSELIPGIFLPETREGLLKIVRRLVADERIDAIILGGTELPLILTGDAVDGVPLVDTTAVHVREIVEELAR